METFKVSSQSDFAPHNSENIPEGWVATRKYLDGALLVAFDGCHKIYLAMDESEADFFRNNYTPKGEFDDSRVVENDDPEFVYETLQTWWHNSCSLRFISAVWRNDEDPNAGFVDLISQFADGEDH